MILLKCPNCGERNVSEFRFGGERVKRPSAEEMSRENWADYLYTRRNVQGVQHEWWYHTPCSCWFIAERHTKTQGIVGTYFLPTEGQG